MRLTKKCRVVWDSDKKIILLLNNSYPDSVTYTIKDCFESDEYVDIENKISELGLIMPEEEEWME